MAHDGQGQGLQIGQELFAKNAGIKRWLRPAWRCSAPRRVVCGGPEHALDLFEAAFVQSHLLHDAERHGYVQRHHRDRRQAWVTTDFSTATWASPPRPANWALIAALARSRSSFALPRGAVPVKMQARSDRCRYSCTPASWRRQPAPAASSAWIHSSQSSPPITLMVLAISSFAGSACASMITSLLVSMAVVA